MSSSQNKDLQHLADKIIPTLKKNGVLRASIFGSAARMLNDSVGDIDLLLDYEKGITLLDIAALQIELERILDIKVDLVSSQSLHPRIKSKVLKEQVRIL